MIKTIHTLGWVIWLFVYMLVRWPKYWWGKHLIKQGRTGQMLQQLNRRVSLWSRRLLHHVKADLTVEGLENLPPAGEPVLYVANHQSYIDIPVLLGNIDPPPPLFARKEIGQVPLLGGWMRQLGCVFVQREDARAAVAAMREAEAVLAGGRSLIVFPEGTRSKGPELGKFLPGSIRIGVKAGVRIVPVAIEGTYKILEGNGYRVPSKKQAVRLVFLPPVETKGLDKEQQKALPQILEDGIRAAKDGPNADTLG